MENIWEIYIYGIYKEYRGAGAGGGARAVGEGRVGGEGIFSLVCFLIMESTEDKSLTQN